MMETVRIPEKHVAGLTAILKLEDSQVDRLADALQKAPLVMWGKRLMESLSPGLNDIPPEDLSEILKTLIGMCSALLRYEISVENFSMDVSQALEGGTYDQLRLTPEESKNFRNRLTKLLDSNSLIYPAKGLDILSSYDRLFTYSRIFTDVRPVFSADVEIRPKAAMIVHTLRLSYQHDEEEQELYVTMDSSDLKLLCSAVQRAQKKEENLCSLLAESDIVCLDLE